MRIGHQVRMPPAGDVDPVAFRSCVDELVAEGRNSEALTVIDRGISQHPDDAGMHDLKASLCARMGKLDDAIASYTTATGLAQGSITARTFQALSSAFVHHNRLAEAQSICLAGLECFPEAWQLREVLVVAYARSGKLEEALRLLDVLRASKQGPPAVWVYQGIVSLLVSRYLYNEATLLVQQAEQENPDCVELEATEAFLWCINGRFAEGITRYMQASESAPPQPTWRYMGVVVASLQRRDSASAAVVVRRAEVEQAGDPLVVASGLMCLLHGGRLDEALDRYSKACPTDGPPGVWGSLRSLALQGRARKAWLSRLASFYKLAVDRNPVPDALEGRFNFAFDSGAYEEAEELFGRLAASGAAPSDSSALRQRYLRTLLSPNRDPVFAKALRRMDLESLDYSIKVSHRYKVVYVSNPKAASSSIRSALAALEIGALEYGGFVHANDGEVLVPLRGIASEKPFEHMREQGYRFFTFTRHPHARATSCYRNKFMLWPPVDYFVAALLDEEEEWPREGVSLDWFVEHVIRQPNDAMDPHWARQVDQTMADIIEIDFVGRVENLAADLGRLMDMLGVDSAQRPKLPFLNATLDERPADEGAVLGDRLAAELRRKYAVDFDHFGYS